MAVKQIRNARCSLCKTDDVPCSHPPPTFGSRFKLFAEKSTVRPFILMMVYFLVIQFGGYTPMRPYLIQIFATLQIPMEAKWATVCVNIGRIFKGHSVLFIQIGVAIISLIGTTMCMICVKYVGNRLIYLSGTAMVSVCLLMIGKLYIYNI